MQQRSHTVSKCYLSFTYSEALTSDKKMCIVQIVYHGYDARQWLKCVTNSRTVILLAT